MKYLLITILLLLAGCQSSNFIGSKDTSITKYRDEKSAKIIDAKEKDGIKIEIGDKTKDVFEPELNISKWENEVKFKIKPKKKDNKHIPELIATDDLIIYKESDQVEYHYYDIAPSAEHEDGAYEFEVIYNSKPKSNKVVLDIETKGLDFFYQPALTQEEIDAGYSRPDNIIGSYAVYHNSKKNNEYKTGKAFHIYRPKIIDANKDWTWAEMDIKNKELTITIDQTWIDNAVYPIIVDPTFGYTSIGGSDGQLWSSGRLTAYKFTGSAGTGDSISVYGAMHKTDGDTIKMVLYDASRNKVSNGETDTSSSITSTSYSWQTLDFSTSPTLTAQDYWIGGSSSGGGPPTGNYFKLKYDTGDTNFYSLTGITYPTFPASINAGSNNYKLSIYATYTASEETTDDALFFGVNF